MRNIFKDYPLYQFNKDLLETIKDKRVNHIQLVAANDQAKVSVVLKPNGGSEYYGLHPKFSEDRLFNFIKSLSMYSVEAFWNNVFEEQNCNHWFSLEENNKTYYPFQLGSGDYETLLFGRVILQMVSHYGYKLHCDKETLICLKEISYKLYNDINLNEYISLTTPNQTYYYKCNQEDLTIDMLGLWPSVFLEELSKRTVVKVTNNQLHIRLKNKNDINLNREIKLTDILNTNNKLFKQYFRLITTDVYYSGVMPRVTSIDYDDSHASSSDIKYISLNVGRTTFATVDCMDNSEILNHPFFKKQYNGTNIYDWMLNFDKNEDIMQDKYLYTHNDIGKTDNQRIYEKESINQINQYLSHSYNTHTIAVSANIETSDDYLLVGKRGKLTIDNNEYYCSVNGQSEFNDENVTFYKQSVYEDLPTMNFSSNSRVDLNNEIHRESIAEIGVSLFEKDWDYYGISFLSINNQIKNDSKAMSGSESKPIKKRRMHFNVLMYNKAYHDFDSVLSNHKHVTEKFENSLFEGIKVRVYKNFWNHLGILIDRGATHAYDHSGLFSLLIVFLLFIINLIRGQNIGIDYSGVDIFFNGPVVGVYILAVFIKWAMLTKTRRFKRVITYRHSKLMRSHIIKKKTNKASGITDKINKNFIKKNKIEPHAILDLMYTLYVLQKANDYTKREPYWRRIFSGFKK